MARVSAKAQVELSGVMCVLCKMDGVKNGTRSFLAKLKDGSFQGSVCVDHLVKLLEDRQEIGDRQAETAKTNNQKD